jgi:hypothetical protein
MEYKFYYHARRKVIIQGGDCVEDLESYEFASSPNQLIGRRRATTGSKATIMDKEKHSIATSGCEQKETLQQRRVSSLPFSCWNLKPSVQVQRDLGDLSVVDLVAMANQLECRPIITSLRLFVSAECQHAGMLNFH